MWVINKRVKIVKVNTKQNTDKVIGIALIELTKQIVLHHSRQNMACILKQTGFATLPPAIEAVKAKYGFHDTVSADPADDGLADNIPQPTEVETV